MDHPLQCRCGTIKGYVSASGLTKRAICYCRDCQAFAHFLGTPDAVLDADGGTDVVATTPGNVRFEQGIESLACMSLSPRGLLRWYARCCSTPIGNTPRDFKTSYVGLVHNCLGSAQALDASFGRPQMKVNTKSAKRPVKSTPLVNLKAIAALMRALIGARLGGRYRMTPFFVPETGVPIVQPRELTEAERERITAAL